MGCVRPPPCVGTRGRRLEVGEEDEAFVEDDWDDE